MDDFIKEFYSKALKSGGSSIDDAQQIICSAEAYDESLLSKVPKQIVENDFGCGNPSKYVRLGEVVLDLGSGSGKICYILSQVVGPTGRVVGVDFNPDMLALSRSQQHGFVEKIGFDNMSFKLGKIYDLKTDLEKQGELLAKQPICSSKDLEAFKNRCKEIFTANPLIPDNSIDVIVSNCVINLVQAEQKRQIFQEMYRVLKPGGRIAISDNVSNVPVPISIQDDPKLWAACYGGVFQEQEFYEVLENAGFVGLNIQVRSDTPTKVIGGIEFRSVTITAYKSLGQCTFDRASSAGEFSQVMYRGPWKEVITEHGVRLKRGQPIPFADAGLMGVELEPYKDELVGVGRIKGLAKDEKTVMPAKPESSCSPGSGCCG